MRLNGRLGNKHEAAAMTRVHWGEINPWLAVYGILCCQCHPFCLQIQFINIYPRGIYVFIAHINSGDP